MSEFCSAETPHRGGLLLRWDQNERQFFDNLERTWRPVSEWRPA